MLRFNTFLKMYVKINSRFALILREFVLMNEGEGDNGDLIYSILVNCSDSVCIANHTSDFTRNVTNNFP